MICIEHESLVRNLELMMREPRPGSYIPHVPTSPEPLRFGRSVLEIYQIENGEFKVITPKRGIMLIEPYASLPEEYDFQI